jgi:hypothetical protein
MNPDSPYYERWNKLQCFKCGRGTTHSGLHGHENGWVCYECEVELLQSQLSTATDSLRIAHEALVEIRDHPNKRYYGHDEWENGRAYGHRTCVFIAERAVGK